jgi:5-methylcytosine-specific restriction endonuclease McrA
MTPRREFSAATRRAAWQRCQGFCEGRKWSDVAGEMTRCLAPIDLGNFHYDHIDPDWFSSDNDLDNCQVLCRVCHQAKTKRDVKNISKSKRIRDKLIKARKPKGRPIPGSKRSGWRKRMDGTVERR